MAEPSNTERLGLPSEVRACLFDLDGVLTRTSVVHAAAWKWAFDEALEGLGATVPGDRSPFDPVEDYRRYVDGRSRADGVRTFLSARGVDIGNGDIVETIGRSKNQRFLDIVRRDGVEVYEGSRRYLDAVVDAGLARAVESSSQNAVEILRVTDLLRWFPTVVDGVVTRDRHLAGKPAPDTFLFGASELGVAPSEAAVFEDALAGVSAGRAGAFGIVIGVDRAEQADELRDAGADRVVQGLEELLD